MDWTKDYFDEFYLNYFLRNQREDITDKQINLVKSLFKKGNTILDAGCGIGRHTIKLGELGFNVLGVDSSPLYIKIAKEKAESKKLSNVSFRVSDIRDLNFSDEFDGVVSLWSSFGYFNDETNFKIVENFHKVLRIGGKLILDVENRDYILKYFVRETFKESGDTFILERRRFHPKESVVTTHRYIIGKDFRRDYVRHIRIYSATELINLFKRVGFKVSEVYGDYDFEKFSESSKRIIIIGIKS